MKDRVKVDLLVRNKKQFLKDLIARGFFMYSIEEDGDYLSLVVDYDSYSEIVKSKIIKKHFIRRYYGKGRIKWLFRKYGIFLFFLFFGILMNIFLSNLIFDIEVVTSNRSLKKQMLQDLEELGVKKYHFKLSFPEKERLKEKLLEKEKDFLEWIEVDERGTKFVVYLEEKKLNEKEEVCEERNLVSKKKAILTKIESSEGEIVKKINDYVIPGEVIISGVIHNGEEEVSRKCAIGKVFGEVWYRVVVELPKFKTVRERTGKDSFGIFLSYHDKEYLFPKKYEVFEKSEYNIIRSDVSSFQIGFAKVYEVIEYQEKYSSKEILELAYQEAIHKVLKDYSTDGVILKKNVLKKTTSDSKIIIELFLAVEEDITDYGVIPEVIQKEE